MRKIKITKRQYLVIRYLYRLSGFIFILGITIGFAILTNKLIEFTVMFLAYFITKGLYPYQYHTESARNCFLISILVFIALTWFTLPKQYSIMFSALLGLLTTYISYKIGLNQFRLKQFGALTMPEPELRAFCEKSGLNTTEQEIVVLRLINGLKGRELYNKIGYSKVQLTRIEKKIERKLGINLK